MPERAISKQSAPAEVISGMNLGYNGFTDPTQTKPQMWSAATNVFSGAFGLIQRCRFANVVVPVPLTNQPFTSMKYFALPGVGAYLTADIITAGHIARQYSYDTGANYAQTQRINPYVDPSGVGNPLMAGPWSKEALGNILYEMNGRVKQAGRNANAATIEGFGLDAPDASPQVTLISGAVQTITSITRSNGVVTATLAGSFTSSGPDVNILSVVDPSFNGTYLLVGGNGSSTLTWNQFGQNTTSSGGTVDNKITKAVGRSYAYAWENANKSHIGSQSPATQYILYNGNFGSLQLVEPGTITLAGTAVTGTGTFFTSAWIGRSLWAITSLGASSARITAVANATHMTIANSIGTIGGGGLFQVFDPQSTHIRLYATSDGGATYLRIARNVWDPTAAGGVNVNGLTFIDSANSEPPNFPFTTEVVQTNNLPPPIGAFLNEYQGRLCVYGVTGALQSLFYSNQETTQFGLPQESFAPLNQITFPIANAKVNGMIEFPGSAVIWSDKQDMFRLTGLLTDNTVTGIASDNAAAQQGASIARLPYSLGCAHPEAATITPLGGIWLTSNAEVWLYTDRYAPRNVGRPVQDILNTILPANLQLARMKYYHTNTRNWLTLSVAANSGSYNNTVLVLDLDLLASNGEASYFTFDMATNSPAWWVFQPGTTIAGNWVNRCDCLEVVYEQNGLVRLLSGQFDLIQDLDYSQGGFGTEIAVPNGAVTTHAWGNDHPFVITRPAFIRFNTNRDPSMLASDGWTFQAIGVDDDFYTFNDPLVLALTPGINDSSTLGGNPDFSGGLAFRHSPELYRIGGVNFVMGRRIKFQVNFPSAPGVVYQLRAIQMGFGANPPN